MMQTDYRSFLVRLWRTTDDDGTEHWCGEVEYIQSGKLVHCASLYEVLRLLLPDPIERPPTSDSPAAEAQ